MEKPISERPAGRSSWALADLDSTGLAHGQVVDDHLSVAAAEGAVEVAVLGHRPVAAERAIGRVVEALDLTEVVSQRRRQRVLLLPVVAVAVATAGVEHDLASDCALGDAGGHLFALGEDVVAGHGERPERRVVDGLGAQVTAQSVVLFAVHFVLPKVSLL